MTLPLLVVQFLLVVAIHAYGSFAIHKIWTWYPPFGYSAPSSLQVFAIITILSLVKLLVAGIDSTKSFAGETSSEYGRRIVKDTFMYVFGITFALAYVFLAKFILT